MENNDLGPLPSEAAPQRLSRAQEHVLTAVRDQGRATTLAELSAATGLHTNTLRAHLDVLTADGLLVRERSVPAGRGRPAWQWRIPAPAHPEYAGLAAALAHTVKATSPQPTVAAMEAGRVWGRQLAEGARAPAADPCTEAVGLLDDLGFAPRERRSPRTTAERQVRLTRCPLLEAAREEPTIVCNVHLGLVAGALETYGAPDPDVQLTPFAEPGACLLRISAGTPG